MAAWNSVKGLFLFLYPFQSLLQVDETDKDQEEAKEIGPSDKPSDSSESLYSGQSSTSKCASPSQS